MCPDFTIRRHDTKPSFKVSIGDCDGPLDLSEDGLVLEANMWANAKLKVTITTTSTYFSLASNIGFNQVMVGDIIVMDRVRLPEHMLVTGFDETNFLIQVQRGYNGTQISEWKKGTALRIFRAMNAPAIIETVLGDVTNEDGSVSKNQLLETFLVFEWTANTTCLPGCYWVEFKLLKMTAEVSMLATGMSITPSFTPSTWGPENFGCVLGDGVEWARRFPTQSEGFLVQIINSPTTEII